MNTNRKGIHPKALKAFEEKIVKSLEAITISGRKTEISYAAWKLALSALNTLGKKDKEEFESILGDFGLFDFIDDFLSDILSGSDITPEEKPKALSSVLDIHSTAKEMINQLLLLPKKYIAFLRLPIPDFGDTLTKIDLSDRVRIVKPTDDEILKFRETDKEPEGPIPWVGELWSEKYGFWQENKVYLSIAGDGYIKKYSDTPLRGEISQIIRTIIGLCLALGVLSLQRATYTPATRIPVSYFEIDKEVKLVDSRDLSEDESRIINRIQIPDKIYDDPLAKWRRFRANPDEQFDGRDSEIIKETLAPIYEILRNVEDDQARRIRTASQWYFASFCNRNETLAYIQASTALESLLGERNPKSNLVELLANRCAYSIAASSVEREEIMKSFKRIYDTRSRILHQGYNILSRDQMEDFDRLQRLLRRTIYREIHLYRNKKSQSSNE